MAVLSGPSLASLLSGPSPPIWSGLFWPVCQSVTPSTHMLASPLSGTTSGLWSGRDGKTYKRVSNACVIFFLGWVKSVLNFMLFCRISALCGNFGFFGVILLAFDLVNF